MTPKPLVSLALATTAVALLAGCTGTTHTTGPTTTPTPTSSSSGNSALLQHRNACAGGQATITADTTLPKGCDQVAVLANNVTVTIGGPVKTLYIEGNGNTIHAQSVATVNAHGTQANSVTYSGAAPDVTDAGTANTFAKH